MSDSTFKQQQAHLAYEAHAAMAMVEKDNPALRQNPYWRALRDTAYARSKLTLEAM